MLKVFFISFSLAAGCLNANAEVISLACHITSPRGEGLTVVFQRNSGALINTYLEINGRENYVGHPVWVESLRGAVWGITPVDDPGTFIRGPNHVDNSGFPVVFTMHGKKAGVGFCLGKYR